MNEKSPNLLFFIMDDQRADTIARAGCSNISTPTLDNLIDNGVFLRPYTTVPVCTPGRAEVLTGRNAFRNGCRWFGEPISPEHTLLPQALRNAGYHCCHIGKWHNDGHPRDKGYHETHTVYPSDATGNPSQYLEFTEDDQPVSGHSTEIFTDQAIEFLDRTPTDHPWFCYVALYSPHDPRTAPEPWASMYKTDRLPPLPENFMPEHPFDNGDMMIRDERLAGFPRRQAEVRDHLADYYAMITHHDHHIGRVLDHLEKTGQKDNTLIVFTSDHGLSVGSHGLMGKENLYEHSSRVPLILSGPGIPKGQLLDNSCLCAHYDLFPTLMELMDLPVPESCEGISYLDVLKGSRTTIRDTVCAGYRDCMRMARDERYKIIHYAHIDRTQFFDLQEDPEELNDLLLPWRRYPETRFTSPSLSPTQTEYIPDPDPRKETTNFFNPYYEPAMPANEVDAKLAELRNVMNQWQNEMNDPIA